MNESMDKDKRERPLTRDLYLLKAAELMNKNGQFNIASYLVNQAAEARDKQRTRSINLGHNGLMRIPKKSLSGDSESEGYYRMTCRFCGALQTPSNTRVRIKPRIRKRKQRKNRNISAQESCKEIFKNDSGTYSDKSEVEKMILECNDRKIKKRKNARKNPLFTTKCAVCNRTSSVPCAVPKKRAKDFSHKQPSSTIKMENIQAKLKNVANNEKISKVASKAVIETPNRMQEELSKSAKKRNRMKNSPLAKLLNQERKPKTSPSLMSFLLN